MPKSDRGDEELAALYDRFLLRAEVKYVTNDHFKNLFMTNVFV